MAIEYQRGLGRPIARSFHCLAAGGPHGGTFPPSRIGAAGGIDARKVDRQPSAFGRLFATHRKFAGDLLADKKPCRDIRIRFDGDLDADAYRFRFVGDRPRANVQGVL